jgi:hypothetical protein
MSENPYWNNVPLGGWSHSLALSKVCDTHLVTQIRNQDNIERFGCENGKEFTCIKMYSKRPKVSSRE